MVRDRDHRAVAARTLADAKRLEAAYGAYLLAARAKASVLPCPARWPPSLADWAPVACDLLEGHHPATKHRHRVTGTQTVLEWP